ncbi:hypothetical protein MKY96_33755 [Paenibacillus sp. FSL R7-0302]|uniref:hypothetical protein n=1 Tax=Paenibacillus sp. FSL R7-0302 TaxID=2921681 RepID=UPI0030FCC551
MSDNQNLPAVNDQSPVVINDDSAGGYISTTIDSFTGRTVQFYSSIPDDGTAETKIKIYNAMSEATGKLVDQLNRTLVLTDLVASPIQFLSEETGELVDAVRMVVFTEDGETYTAVGKGILSSIQNIIGLFGPAPWKPGIPVTPVKKATKNGFDTTILRMVANPSKK